MIKQDENEKEKALEELLWQLWDKQDTKVSREELEGLSVRTMRALITAIKARYRDVVIV